MALIAKVMRNQARLEQLGLSVPLPPRPPTTYFSTRWPNLLLTPQQIHVLRVWGDILARRVPQKHLLIGSGHGLGKTLLMGRMAYYFSEEFPAAKGLTTAPTNRQVLDLLWGEVRTAIPEDFGGLLAPRSASLSWPDGGWLRGFSTNTTEHFQGYHEQYLAAFLDEGPGITGEIWQAVENCCVAENNHIVVIGNPIDPSDDFALRVGDPNWIFVNLSCLDHPNVVTRDSTRYPKMVTYEWVQEQFRKHSSALPEGEEPGEDERDKWLFFDGLWWRLTNFILGRVCGLIPLDAEDQLILSEWVKRAYTNWRENAVAGGDPVVVGCDVARYGGDSSVIYVRRGNVLRCAWKRQGRNTVEVATKVAEVARKERAGFVVVDDTGVGGGVTDNLAYADLPKGSRLMPVLLGGGAMQKQRFNNARTELYFALREWLGKPDVAVEPTDEFQGDVTAPRYTFIGKLLKLESKEHLKARIKRSPDEGDASALCMVPEVYNALSSFAFGALTTGVAHDYKPARERILAAARAQAQQHAEGVVTEEDLAEVGFHSEGGFSFGSLR